MKLNITMMRDTLKCPRLGYNLHVLRRGPLNVPIALEEGQLFHEGMEARFDNRTIMPSDLPSWALVGQEARDSFMKHKMWVPINCFNIPENWKLLGVEQAFSRAITPNLNLVGRLDGVIELNGKVWDIQWKTYTDDLLSLVESVRLSWHEVGYQWMASQDMALPWAGTILGACQKLPSYRMVEGDDGKKRRTEVTDEMRAAAFTVHYITRSPKAQDDMSRNLISVAMRVQQDLQKGSPDRNYDHCFGPFRRGRCPFFEVCHGSADINGPSFVDLPDRYSEIP